MDISKFDVVKNAEKGFKYYFKNPYDLEVELPIFMVVMGTDSKVYKKAKRAQQLEVLNKRMSEDKDKKTTAEDLEQLELENIDLMTKLVLSLGETEEDGKDTDFILDDNKECKANKKDIKHLLTKFPWMLNQLSVAITKRSNFLAER